MKEEAAPQDPFDVGIPTPAGITGKLVYVYQATGRLYDWTFRDFNVASSDTKQQAPVISVHTGMSADFSRQEGYKDIHLSSDGESLEFAAYYNDFVQSYYPYHWDFKTGVIKLSPEVPLSLNENPLLILNQSVMWNVDRSLVAYVVPVENDKWTFNDSYKSLAFASRTGRAAFIEPRTEQAFFAWTRNNTLLFDLLVPSLVQHTDIRSSFDWVTQELSKLSPEKWPSIYAASASLLDTPAVKKTKKVKAKLFLAGAFAPIASPDGRLVAFSGWATDKPAAEIKPGEPEVKPGAPQWWVWDSQSKTRTLIGSAPVMPDNAAWSPNSSTLFFSTVTDKVTIQAVDVAGLLAGRLADVALATRKVGEFGLRDIAAQTDPKSKPAELLLRGFSRDRKYLFIGAREFQLRPNTKPSEFDHTDTLHALRLSDGQHQIVARWKNIDSYDWLDLSTPAP